MITAMTADADMTMHTIMIADADMITDTTTIIMKVVDADVADMTSRMKM